MIKANIQNINKIQDTKYRMPLNGNIFFVANSCYRFICNISGIWVVLLYLVNYSQKNEVFLFIIQVEKLIKFFPHSSLKHSTNNIRFYVYITIFLKVCLTIFSMLSMNKLSNRYYINTKDCYYNSHKKRKLQSKHI